MGKTYNEYMYVDTARVQMNGAYTTEDYIQAAAWIAQSFAQICANDPDLMAMAEAHDFMKVKYTGVSVRPEFNIVGMSDTIQIGECGLVPILKDPAYKFAAQATGGSATFDPPDLGSLLNGVAGTRVPQGQIVQGKWQTLWQPGLSLRTNVLSPDWGTDTSSEWTIPIASQWTPLWNSSGASAGLELTDQKVWTPLVCWANFNCTEALPATFTLKFMMKFAFKDRRLQTGNAAFAQRGTALKLPGNVRTAGLARRGIPEPHEVEDEEKKSSEPLSHFTTVPKAARTESNSQLVRQMTNIGLGDTRLPPNPRGPGKRTTEVVMQ